MRKLFCILALVAILLGTTSIAASAASCTVWGTVTNSDRYQNGVGYWVAVRYDNATYASFYSLRPFRVGERTLSYGPCAGADRYSQPWLAWRYR
jgi:hypothetical protein